MARRGPLQEMQASRIELPPHSHNSPTRTPFYVDSLSARGSVSAHRIFRQYLWFSKLKISQDHDLMELRLYKRGTWAGGVDNGC